ncbi:MAG: cell division FtsA domain-containing protein [Euzebya sp.]
MTPAVLDLDAFALLRSVVDVESPGGADPGIGDMVVNVGATVTNIVVHSQGIPRFVRILLMGGNNITESLVNATGMTWEDAEAIKSNPTPNRARRHRSSLNGANVLSQSTTPGLSPRPWIVASSTGHRLVEPCSSSSDTLSVSCRSRRWCRGLLIVAVGLAALFAPYT